MNAQQIITEFNRSSSFGSADDRLFVKKLRMGGLTDDQIAVAITAVQDTCHGCWNNEAGCQCENDE